jgi:hypothetical protein
VEPLFIGKVVWSPKHIGTSTLFFLYFEFILKKNNINVDSTRKISDCKINTLKVERVQNTFENLNSLEIMLKMLKRWKYIKNAFFLGFSLFFSIFGFFQIFIKHWDKNWVATPNTKNLFDVSLKQTCSKNNSSDSHGHV